MASKVSPEKRARIRELIKSGRMHLAKAQALGPVIRRDLEEARRALERKRGAR